MLFNTGKPNSLLLITTDKELGTTPLDVTGINLTIPSSGALINQYLLIQNYIDRQWFVNLIISFSVTTSTKKLRQSVAGVTLKDIGMWLSLISLSTGFGKCFASRFLTICAPGKG